MSIDAYTPGNAWNPGTDRNISDRNLATTIPAPKTPTSEPTNTSVVTFSDTKTEELSSPKEIFFGDKSPLEDGGIQPDMRHGMGQTGKADTILQLISILQMFAELIKGLIGENPGLNKLGLDEPNGDSASPSAGKSDHHGSEAPNRADATHNTGGHCGESNPAHSTPSAPETSGTGNDAPFSPTPAPDTGSTSSATSPGDVSETSSGTPPGTSTATNTGQPAGAATVNEFTTINPGEGPQQLRDENGKFKFNERVDDSFIPEEQRKDMRESVSRNMEMDFFKDNFASEDDAYQYLVHMANLESARGTTLENDEDAQGTGGGSFGFMHLHDTFGLEAEKYGHPLNTEGWSREEVDADMGKYTDLVMRSLDGNYQQSGGGSNPDAMSEAMGMWWTGEEHNTSAGDYYMEALSAGAGVNHHTGSAYI